MADQGTRQTRWLWFFFVNYMWLGIVILLLTVLLEHIFAPLSFIASVVLDTTEAIGIAIIVASIFTYASGTSEFITKIRSLLQDIVVSREFLGNIDTASKREALSSLLKPSSEERQIYSNIEDYYNNYITQTLDISKKCVRSNYSVNYRAYLDRKTGRVVGDGIYTYRLYPTVEGYDAINIAFNEQENLSICHTAYVSLPNGNREKFDLPKLEEMTTGGDRQRKATINLSEIGKGSHHLDIELRVTEKGSDHWLLLKFQALQPTDGFNFTLRCDDDLEIRDHAILVFGARYFIDMKNKQEISVTCTQWIDEGSGLAILVALPHALHDEKFGAPILKRDPPELPVPLVQS